MQNLAKVRSRAGESLQAPRVLIEAHISAGLPSFVVVGLPEAAVRESKERVRSSIINSGFKFPAGRITISLAPADLPKSGGRYDLPIALSILIASKQVTPNIDIDNFEWYAELNLSGNINAVSGLFPAILQAQKSQKSVVISAKSEQNLAIIKGIDIFLATTLIEVCEFVVGYKSLKKLQYMQASTQQHTIDLAEVKGQFLAKRALEIAASGGHNLLLSGTPGSGKTMLAERICTILPAMNFEQQLEVMAIYSIAGKDAMGKSIADSNHRPFRSPHHLSSAVSLVGGGANPKPGEISLAHNGVLFLDELPEFSRSVLEVLRQPLESGVIHISRAKNQVEYPANFQLIAAQNPCPCGYYGDGTNKCHCTSEQITRYKNKISGPFLDRIDMRLSVAPLTQTEILSSDEVPESSKDIAKRVLQAYQIQMQRSGKLNSNLTTSEVEKVVQLDDQQKQLLANAIEKLELSTRAYIKVLKVARTIADLDDSQIVQNQHILEALSYQKQ
jgi:magnesium chelatase family protein